MSCNDGLNRTFPASMIRFGTIHGRLCCLDSDCSCLDCVMLTRKHSIDCSNPSCCWSSCEYCSKVGFIGSCKWTVNWPRCWFAYRQPDEINELLLSSNQLSMGVCQVCLGCRSCYVEHHLVVRVTAGCDKFKTFSGLSCKPNTGVPS